MNLHYIRKAFYRISFAGLSICLRFWIFQGSEYGSDYKHAMVLYIPEFWRHQGYIRILNIPSFCICHGSEYTRVLNIPRFWIYRGYTGFWMSCNIPGYFLNMPGYDCICDLIGTGLLKVGICHAWKIVQRRICIIFVKLSIVDVWEGCEYTRDLEYSSVLNVGLVLNILGF